MKMPYSRPLFWRLVTELSLIALLSEGLVSFPLGLCVPSNNLVSAAASFCSILMLF